MPAYDPAFTAASCFILRPGASGRLLLGFTLFLWLIILYHKRELMQAFQLKKAA